MTTTTRRKTLMTLEQFLALPETKPAREYYGGEVVRKPMPDLPHIRLQTRLWMLIYQLLLAQPLGRVEVEWRCIFGPAGHVRALVPDLAFVSNERLPKGDTRRNRLLRAAPELAVEVLLPNQPAEKFANKLAFYRANGVQLVWVIDPDRETVRVYEPTGDARLFVVGDTLDGGDVLPGFSVTLDDLFAPLREV